MYLTLEDETIVKKGCFTTERVLLHNTLACEFQHLILGIVLLTLSADLMIGKEEIFFSLTLK